MVKKIEEVIVEKGASGRLGTWVYSHAYVITASLGELAKRVVEGNAKLTIEDLIAASKGITPGIKLNGSRYIDIGTGIEEGKLHHGLSGHVRLWKRISWHDRT